MTDVALTAKERIAQLAREQLAVGVLPTSNESVFLWIADAAEKINAKRQKTTRKESTLTLTASATTYALPTDCTTLDELIVEGAELPRPSPFPLSQFPEQWPGGFPTLPTGQRMTGGISRMIRQEATESAGEIRWRVLAGQLVIDFPVSQDTPARIVYTAPDRSVESLPERYWQMVVTYVRMMGISVFISKACIGGTADGVSNTLVQHNIGALRDTVRDLNMEWTRQLSLVTAEAD